MHEIDSNVERIPFIKREDMVKLRQLALPIARFLTERGYLNEEVHIDTLGVQVFSPDGDDRFTDKEVAGIFPEVESHV
ncbi:MAG: hypothetical protein AB9835_12250 [Eubacteriales bacterium]